MVVLASIGPPQREPAGAQPETDASNRAFWDELCGTHLAKTLGVIDDSPRSLKKFDDWFFQFYPYVFYQIPFDEVAGKRVLEVGLGYGTVSQRLAECGAIYSGLDIAPGPVTMVNHRLAQVDLTGRAEQGSILAAPFPDNAFDLVVTIGCLHHTGDMQKAISECHRMLVPGGRLVVMVYYAYSYRRFVMAWPATWRYALREALGFRFVAASRSAADRAAYDTDGDGAAAPHTDWISKRSLRYLCREFASFHAQTENINQESPFVSRSRRELLKTLWPRIVGLDLYATAIK
jgi:SAM-dependent methyltransferase